MTIITIDTDDKKELAKAKSIAKKEGWLLKENKPGIRQLPPPTDGKKLAAILKEFIDKGGSTSFPKDISAWQRETRKDKPLFGR